MYIDFDRTNWILKMMCDYELQIEGDVRPKLLNNFLLFFGLCNSLK